MIVAVRSLFQYSFQILGILVYGENLNLLVLGRALRSYWTQKMEVQSIIFVIEGVAGSLLVC